MCWLVALLGSGCVACGGSSQGETGPIPRGLERYYTQRLDWRACGPNECAFLSVPLDYRNPEGTTARLALLRRRATRPEQRIGSLVVNPGGPGGSGIGLAAYLADRLAPTVLGQRFDLVGFDPRGVGTSQPAVHCFGTGENDAERLAVEVDNSPAGVVRQQERTRRYADACRQRSGSMLLANVGTRDVARDLDVLRSALGDRYLTYYGYSYGTQIAYTYAERFPRNVRAMVLDGPVDPAMSRDEWAIARAAAFQNAFNTFAAWCAGRDCPLGTDPGQATTRYRNIVLALIGRPVGVSDGRKLSYTDSVTATIAALYEPQKWEPLRRGLLQLASGQPPDSLMQLADGFLGRAFDGYDNNRDVLTAVGCVDDDAARASDPATLRTLSARKLAAAPFEDPGTGPDPAESACAMWPVPPTGHPHQPQVVGAPTMLVIAVTGDPATPFQGGLDLARDLRARLITVEGTQHTAGLRGVACVDRPIHAYLTELALPPDGARCSVPPDSLAH
jgi:pimeloyl-ACP methyl ester carboxylesterase